MAHDNGRDAAVMDVSSSAINIVDKTEPIRSSSKPKDFKPVPDWPDDHKWHNTRFKRCQKWSHVNHAQCKAMAVKGMDCCRKHGGRALRGLMAPKTTHGKYSKYLPPRMIERYTLSATDTHLLALREELQVVDARIADLMTRVDTGESGKAWNELRTSLVEYVKAQRVGDFVRERTALDRLKSLIDAGVGDYVAWDEINKMFELRKRLAESERKREMDLKLYISVDESLGLVRALTSTIIELVKDRSLINRIQIRFNELLNGSITAIDANVKDASISTITDAIDSVDDTDDDDDVDAIAIEVEDVVEDVVEDEIDA